MHRGQELASAAVENYGQPAFATCMIEFHAEVGNQSVQLHLLRQAGLKKAMLEHARDLRRQGQHGGSRSVLREVGLRFGNSTKK